jgi:hypothetical protein
MHRAIISRVHLWIRKIFSLFKSNNCALLRSCFYRVVIIHKGSFFEGWAAYLKTKTAYNWENYFINQAPIQGLAIGTVGEKVTPPVKAG